MVNRDDQKFAMKCSAALVDGKWVDVFKDPITDKGKQSKKGKMKLTRMHVLQNDNTMKEQYFTVVAGDKAYDRVNDILEAVFENGTLVRDMTFDEVRANANK